MEGHTYQPGAAIIHRVGAEDEDITIGMITHVHYINGTIVVFRVELYEAEYVSHFRLFALTPLNGTAFVKYDSLRVYIPLHPRRCRLFPQKLCVIMPFYIT
jgi:hypothetical protein